MLYNGCNNSKFLFSMNSDAFWYPLLAISRMKSVCMEEQPMVRRLKYLQKFKAQRVNLAGACSSPWLYVGGAGCSKVHLQGRIAEKNSVTSSQVVEGLRAQLWRSGRTGFSFSYVIWGKLATFLCPFPHLN